MKLKGRLSRDRVDMPIPVVGNIKIGIKSDKGFPMSLDYFIAKSDYKEYEQMFKDAVGEKPNKISIIFCSDDINEACEEALELRDKSGALFCKSDGKDYRVVNNGEWKTYTSEFLVEKYGSIEAFENKLMEIAKGKFKRRLTMKFICTEVKGLLGAWKFTTYADKSSIDNIINTFDTVLMSAGTVKMIPFDLTVTKVKKDMSGSKSIYPVVRLVPNNSIESLNKIKELGGIQNSGILTEDKILKLT